MEAYKQEFIQFMVEVGVLTFGDFTAKSGRKTPYFVNSGRYRTGGQLARLARYYADAIEAQGIEFDFLFGPAYKGIPLAAATAIEFSRRGKEIGFCFNRKETKAHGEGGALVGHTPSSGERALIIEDVTTAGTSIRETVPLLMANANVVLAGLVVAVDRMERSGDPEHSHVTALTQLSEQYEMQTFSVVNVEEVMQCLRSRSPDEPIVLTDKLHQKMTAYLRQYGPTPRV